MRRGVHVPPQTIINCDAPRHLPGIANKRRELVVYRPGLDPSGDRSRSDAVGDRRRRLEHQAEEVSAWRDNRSKSSVVEPELPLMRSPCQRDIVDNIKLALRHSRSIEADLGIGNDGHSRHKERAGYIRVTFTRRKLRWRQNLPRYGNRATKTILSL